MSFANAVMESRGVLLIKPAAANGCGSSRTSGPIFDLTLSPNGRAPSSTASMQPQTIDSANAFEALPIAANLRGQVLFVRALDIGPWLMRLTFETSPQAVIPIAGAGFYLSEFPADDRVTAVELQGQGRIEWTIGGGIV